MAIDCFNLMKFALEEAERGFAENEVPVGAVISDSKGEILARAHNQPVARHDPTAHAEILAIREAGAYLGNYRLGGTTLTVTIEPCLMCMGAAINARITRLIFGAYDPKSGAAGSLYNVASDNRLNHRIEVIPGILKEECAELLKRFFQLRRIKPD